MVLVNGQVESAARKRLIIDGIGFAFLGTILFACIMAVVGVVV